MRRVRTAAGLFLVALLLAQATMLSSASTSASAAPTSPGSVGQDISIDIAGTGPPSGPTTSGGVGGETVTLSPGNTDSGLAFTGAAVVGIGLLAVVLLGLGVVLVLLGRRNRAGRHL